MMINLSRLSQNGYGCWHEARLLKYKFIFKPTNLSIWLISFTSLHQLCFLFGAGNISQLNLERSKSRMGTFVEGGPVPDTNPDEG